MQVCLKCTIIKQLGLEVGGGGGADPALLFLFHENPTSPLFSIAFPNPVFSFQNMY